MASALLSEPVDGGMLPDLPEDPAAPNGDGDDKKTGPSVAAVGSVAPKRLTPAEIEAHKAPAKVSPRYPFDVLVQTPDGEQFLYEGVIGVDEQDAKRAIIEANPHMVIRLTKYTFKVKRKSWEPTNPSDLTTLQVDRLSGLNDDEKAKLKKIARQPALTETF